MRKENIEVNDLYRHFKGNIVKVICIGKHTEDLTTLVVYSHNDEVWIRPIEMFLSEEDVSNRVDNVTKQKYRFERILENDRH